VTNGEGVYITGVGLLCSLGRGYEQVSTALRAGRSGIRAMPDWARLGLKANVGGQIDSELKQRSAERIPPNVRSAMSEAGLLCSLAAFDALEDAGLSAEDLNRARNACIVGSAVPSTQAVFQATQKLYAAAARKISPYTVLRAMCSSASTSVAGALGMHGRSYSLSSACATSAHSIGHAYELIRSGRTDVAIAGGGDELSEHIAAAFDALRTALSTRYNDKPEGASRPYDANRDGLVLSGGAGIVVLESESHMRQRQARPRARVVGFGANTGPGDLVLPDRSGAAGSDCMKEALGDAGLMAAQIDAINTHGTGTVAGDLAEVNAMRQVFGPRVPPFSSTKSMTGHALGGAGAIEAIFCVAMLEGRCIMPSINIEAVDPEFKDLPIVRHCESADSEYVLSNSFGFGGTNASLILGRV
jgi:3-oxoacyl-[acyl-carrier-protein] synthase-1